MLNDIYVIDLGINFLKKEQGNHWTGILEKEEKS